jgi:hypothetical protein
LDEYELAAGKLAALLARRTGRDLFDALELLSTRNLEEEKLRLGFVLYGGMNIEDWRRIGITDVDPAARDLETYLLPLLRKEVLEDLQGDGPDWKERLLKNCREALSSVLPLRANEHEFLDRLLDQGEIEPECLTGDGALADRIRRHSNLRWKAHNVRKHFGLL